MTAIVEGKNLYDVVKWEEECFYSRDTVVVASSNTVTLGEAIALDGTGKCAHWDDSATTSLSTIAGVALARGVPDDVIPVLTRQAIVCKDGITYSHGVSDPGIAVVTAALKTKGILVRDGV